MIKRREIFKFLSKTPIILTMTWFIHLEDKILGPFPTDQILRDLKSGEIGYGAHIWSKGQVEWTPIADWENNLDHLLAMSGDQSQQKWRLRMPKKVIENLNFDQVILELKKQENFSRIAVSPQAQEKWTPIYSSYAFMEALNLSRRNFLRAPLMGLAKITKDGSRFSYVVRTATLGQGGMGVYGLGAHFEVGTQVVLRIESEDLKVPIHVNATVVYNTDQGFVGLRFGDLTAENLTIVVDYLRRFQGSDEFELKAS